VTRQSVSVVVLARELFPWLRPGVESEDRVADRIRELAGILGVRLAVVPEWRGHLTVSAAAADRLLAASEAHQEGRAIEDETARSGGMQPARLSDLEVYRQDLSSPQAVLARKREALRMAGATEDQMFTADVRRGANGL
jgi:hypothetical protein